MSNKLKIINIPVLFSLILFAASCGSYRSEVLLAGTIHFIPDSLQQNWDKYRNFLEEYKPDAICVEYRIPADTVSLIQAAGNGYFKILDSLKIAWQIESMDSKNKINELKNELKVKDDWRKRIALYKLYTVNADAANAHYQAWQVYNTISQFTKEEKEKIRMEYTVYIRIERIIQNMMHNEYFQVVFPLALKYKIDYLYPVDDRSQNDSISVSYQDWYDALKGSEFDTKWKNFYIAFNKTEEREMKNGNALIFVNSAAWQQQADYAQTGLLGESKNQRYFDYVRFWNFRNEKVTGNILDAIKGKGFKKCLVFMGYMHIPSIKKHMNKHKEIAVKTLNDYKELY